MIIIIKVIKATKQALHSSLGEVTEKKEGEKGGEKECLDRSLPQVPVRDRRTGGAMEG